MRTRFLLLLARLSEHVGDWLFRLVARGIAAGYFLFAADRRRTSVAFYGHLFPQRGRLHAHRCAWGQFRNFTDLFLDHSVTMAGNQQRLTYSVAGAAHLRQTHAAGKGGVLLMSHLGNWQAAAHMLNRDLPEIPLMLYMGQAQKQQIERHQKAVLKERGVRIVAVDEAGGSPFDIVEGVRFLREGGVVSLTGDRLWRPGQRSVSARFLGRTIHLPEAPYILALMGGAPLIYFFAFRTGPGHYHISASPPQRLQAVSRQARPAAIQAAAQHYAEALEAALRAHPLQWYHFDPIFQAPAG
ncbi:MAG: lysophospholipid acyltransferase family protein [Desulfosarcinaceae bacterium]|nr:lysophospholipid acyltransferase family protein [Desulfosarcinaceae bacterium]